MWYICLGLLMFIQFDKLKTTDFPLWHAIVFYIYKKNKIPWDFLFSQTNIPILFYLKTLLP